MSDDVMVRAEESTFLDARRRVLLWPAILATVVGGALLALWLFQAILISILLHYEPDLAKPEGAVLIRPSRSEEVATWIRFLVPLALGFVLLALTWRFRGKGQRIATCACAAATILTGVLCWVVSAS